MKCFYHKSDLDGHCSGAIVKMKYPDCEMFGVDYNDHISQFEFKDEESVFVVDFSFPMEEMHALNSIVKVYWLDHHKSAAKDAFDAGYRANGVHWVDTKQAGCELTWQYIYPEQDMPLAVFLLGRYDVWDHDADPRVLMFQYGMRQLEHTEPSCYIWYQLFNDYVKNYSEKITSEEAVQCLCKDGELIMKYEDSYSARYLKGMHFEREWEGFRALIMNRAYTNSRAFEALYDPDKHDIMVMFGYKPGEVKYTLFCDKPDIDVSVIAKKYGGGGHKGAAGFYLDHIIW